MQLRINRWGDEGSELPGYNLDTEEGLHRCTAPDSLRAVRRPSVRRFVDVLSVSSS